jgi:DNA mismatch repair protein MSH2
VDSLKKVTDVIELSTQKNGIHFTTKRLQSLSESYVTLSHEYVSKQSLLVKEIIAVVATYVPLLERLNELVAELDVVSTFAHIASTSTQSYVRPMFQSSNEENVSTSRHIHLVEARHPVMESIQHCQFIPNDVLIDSQNGYFQIITGPNMGGKSTYMRQVALIVLLAHIGCYVPCTTATMSIFDGIFTRIGASDSTLKGISTFMAEMIEMSSILKSATPNSLVIVDELGRGTSFSDGFGIAWALSEYNRN